MKKALLFTAIASLIVVAHLFGFKLFGKPTLVNNQPLKNPQKISNISTGGNIVFPNGKEYGIYGIITILPNPLEQIKYFKFHIPMREVEIESPDQTVTKVWAKTRNLYPCGNTWLPRPFPPRLPAFSKTDLAQILISHGGAIPDVSVFKESPEYAQELMKALSDIVADLRIEQNSQFAVELGRYLIDAAPAYFREGAWLLALNNKSETFDIVTKKIDDLISQFEDRKKTLGFYAGDTRNIIIDCCYILMKGSKNKAKRFLLPHIHSDIDVYLRVDMATVLLSVDDYSGYDILMDEMIAPGIDRTRKATLNHRMDDFLSNSTPNEYYPYDDPQKMYQWYQQNKSQLHWDRKKWHMSH